MSIPVVIDCDPGHDDAIALLLALARPELDVKAVTTVAGNQPLKKTTRDALRVLELAGRLDLPVGAGAERPLARELRVADWIHGASGLDGPEPADPVGEVDPRHAIDLIADAVRGSDEPITLNPLGPLTNVALLLARYPAEGARLGRVVLMGGAIGLGNITPAAEFNIWQDPEAARRVFSSGLDITMVGLDVTHKASLAPRMQTSFGNVGASAASLPSCSTSSRVATARSTSSLGLQSTMRPRLPTSSATTRCHRARCGQRRLQLGAGPGGERSSTVGAGRGTSRTPWSAWTLTPTASRSSSSSA
ncbi:MAG: nucleoside hydrolase [Actinomycetia bacterium]|nr:nucleoside hydrolase [Actinomycetes bacterium]